MSLLKSDGDPSWIRSAQHPRNSQVKGVRAERRQSAAEAVRAAKAQLESKVLQEDTMVQTTRQQPCAD